MNAKRLLKGAGARIKILIVSDDGASMDVVDEHPAVWLWTGAAAESPELWRGFP